MTRCFDAFVFFLLALDSACFWRLYSRRSSSFLIEGGLACNSRSFFAREGFCFFSVVVTVPVPVPVCVSADRDGDRDGDRTMFVR